LSPKRDRTKTQNIAMCCKRIIALKYHHIFLWAITLNATKTRANFTPTCLKIKKHLWANGFKSPALACVFHKFSPEPPWECKQLRDADGHPEYIIRFQQTADGYLRTFG